MFLRNLVARRGHSGLDGVYLTGVKVSADPCTDYGYDFDPEKLEYAITSFISREKEACYSLLVDTRLYDRDLVHTLCFKRNGHQVTVYFITEDHDISAMVFIPALEVNDFTEELVFYQHLLEFVAKFAGKNPNTLQFTIGAATIDWSDMVDQGDAREVDVSY